MKQVGAFVALALAGCHLNQSPPITEWPPNTAPASTFSGELPAMAAALEAWRPGLEVRRIEPAAADWTIRRHELSGNATGRWAPALVGYAIGADCRIARVTFGQEVEPGGYGPLRYWGLTVTGAMSYTLDDPIPCSALPP